MSEPRVYTREEIREKLFNQLKVIAKYWAEVPEEKTTLGRIEGAIFSTLVVFDGGSMALPGFTVTPFPAPEDEEYCKSNGENWFPNDVDIAGEMYSGFINYKK